MKSFLESRSEYAANLHLQKAADEKPGQKKPEFAQRHSPDQKHHVVTVEKGRRVPMAGPFANRAAADKHIAKHGGIAVPSHLLEDKYSDQSTQENMDQLTEAKKGDNYHSVFVQGEDGVWSHHADADDKEDARLEMDSIRNQGVKTKSFVVPKGEADWHKKDVHAYVTGRLQKSVKEANDAGFDGEQLDEALTAIKHGNEYIATTGNYHLVGMKKNDQGYWDHDSSAVFDKMDDAKAFVDGGKKGPHTTVAQSVAARKAKEPAVHESFLDAALAKDFTAAESAFKKIMAEKINVALAARKIEIAQSLYNKAV